MKTTSASCRPFIHSEMFDIALRSLKDRFFDPVSKSIPLHISPLHITIFGFLCGLFSCVLASARFRVLSVLFWAINRILDCLDGAVARQRRQQSDLGGFLDLLADFIVYALIPISCAYGNSSNDHLSPEKTVDKFVIVALLEGSFYLNNFILFYIAALVEKGNSRKLQRQQEEVTNLAMRPALVEGFESGVFFTLMLAMPHYVGQISLLMLCGVVFGTGQRAYWLIKALSSETDDSKAT